MTGGDGRGFAGRSYVVLGATGGIGSEVARRLRRAGARLVVGARTVEDVEELAEELDALPWPLDARSFREVDECVQAAVDEHGGLDGLVNAVGSILIRPAHMTREQDLRDVLETNLVSAFAAVRAGVGAMRNGDGGSLVLFSTAAVRSAAGGARVPAQWVAPGGTG